MKLKNKWWLKSLAVFLLGAILFIPALKYGYTTQDQVGYDLFGYSLQALWVLLAFTSLSCLIISSSIFAGKLIMWIFSPKE